MSLSENDFIHEVKRLRTRSYRQETGLVIVEGLPELKKAIQAKIPIQKLFVCPEIIDFDYKKVKADQLIEVSKETFAKIAFGSRLKGILALAHPEQKTLSRLKLSQTPLIVVLEAVEKPGNLGAVIRSADGAGVDAVLMVDSKTDVYNQHVVRSSIGTLFSLPVIATSKEEAAAFLKEHHIQILAATAKAQQNYTDINFTQPTAVVVGNEHDGLSDFWLKQATERILIPMKGVGACLNVTVSASILIYEALRQRHTL